MCIIFKCFYACNIKKRGVRDVKTINVANGYYKINQIHYFTINKVISEHNCLSSKGISNREELKQLFRVSLDNSLSSIDEGLYFMISFDGFANIIGCCDNIKWCKKILILGGGNITGLYKFWKCDLCDNCSLNCYIKTIVNEINNNNHQYVYLFRILHQAVK